MQNFDTFSKRSLIQNMEFSSFVIKEERNDNFSTKVKEEHEDLTHALLIKNKDSSSSVIKMEPESDEHFLSNYVPGDQTDTLVKNDSNERMAEDVKIFANEIDNSTDDANREENDESSDIVFGNQSDTLVKNEGNEIMAEDVKIYTNEIDDCTIKNDEGLRSDVTNKASDKSDSVFRKKYGAYTYDCNQCDYKAIQKRLLKMHLLKHEKANSDAIKVKCDSCDYETVYKFNLKTHALRHKNHEELEKFKCDHCEYKTIKKNNLRRHLQRHRNPEEIARFKCCYCKYQTTRKSDMQQHCLLHKNPDEVDMLKCNTCSFKTIWKLSLKRHIMRHTKPKRRV